MNGSFRGADIEGSKSSVAMNAGCRRPVVTPTINKSLRWKKSCLYSLVLSGLETPGEPLLNTPAAPAPLAFPYGAIFDSLPPPINGIGALAGGGAPAKSIDAPAAADI
ncbi:hypothetical protein BKA57DRAFT_538324 [Linnemannia elongata]|nr:hypothetical protein BKA57DRAFT_538324 [Linnemannia elongata]